MHSRTDVGTPRYQLKMLLVALRRVCDISEQEMAKKIGISRIDLIEYERTPKPFDKYDAVYIEVLDEYVSLASKQARTFEDALKIYMNQKNLHKYNTSYKLALFYSILYDSLYVNLNSNEETVDAQTFPTCEVEVRYHVWSNEQYNTAFFLLGIARKLFKLDATKIAQTANISLNSYRTLEHGVRDYKTLTNLDEIVKAVADAMDVEIKKQMDGNDLHGVVLELVNQGHTMHEETEVLKDLLIKGLMG